MDPTSTTVISDEIKALIRFLAHGGGSIMKGHTKFTVTPAILKQINDVLEMMRKDIFVSSLTNRDLICKFAKNDLMFLYDFVKKTPNLKISSTVSSHDIFVDVQDFSNLSYLELYKFNVKQIKNVEFLRERLEAVVCARSLENVGDLLLSRNGHADKIWKLKHAIFSRNGISKLDQSFIYTPYLQYLDLSYNHLTNLCQLTCLLNLTYLNVSYNNLKEVPTFPMSKLKTLLLSNNYISDIAGISRLENLRECDLSENLLAEHADLFPLSDLESLTMLNLSKNPICYHPMYRNLTCGYLHENVANEYFLLDGSPLTSAEREFVRHCSRYHFDLPPRRASSVSLNSEREKDTVIKKKTKKKPREPVIADKSYDDEEDVSAPVRTTPPTPTENEVLERDCEKYLEIKKEIESLRATRGAERWLLDGPGVKVQQLLNIDDPQFDSLSGSPGVSVTGIDSKTPANEAEILMERLFDKDSSYLENVPTENENDDDVNDPIVQSRNPRENEYGPLPWSSSDSQSEDSDDESDTEESLWLVTKINSDSSEEKVFLTLTDTELKERVVGNDKSKLKDRLVGKNKLIKRWNLSTIERFVKVSSDPLTLAICFNVLQRSDQYRKYIMEYADAQKLMSRIEEELNQKSLKDLLVHDVFHCIKCNSYFCQEKQKRKMKDEIKYQCPTCGSKAVIKEEDPELLLASKGNAGYPPSPAKNTSENNKSVKVTQSPSMSSIGSAASLDQTSESITNDDPGAGCQESDIEIISNPSQSSIEVLEVHSGDNTRTVFPRLSNTDSSVLLNHSLTNSHTLTESSSSGSMTDSVCTSYEAGSHINRVHHVSQSMVDEVLMEETSAENSPQQCQNEEKSIVETNAKKCNVKISQGDTSLENEKLKCRGGYLPEDIKKIKVGSFTSVLEDVIQRITMSTSPRKSVQDFNGTYKYSYTDFSYIDHRIKLYIWDQVVPTNEEISAFVRVNAICKSGTSNPPFIGFLVLTNKKMHILKIIGEEKGENPAAWLQKNESVNTEKIKLIQPIHWKQGFCIEVDDRASYNINTKYLMLLYDEKRTDSFLAFVRDLGTIHVQKSDDFSEEKDLKNLLEIDENIRNFTLTDSIVLYKEDVEIKNFGFVGLVITNSEFMILKAENDWLLPNSSTSPTVLLKESMSNLANADKTSSSIKLVFVDEAGTIETVWDVSVVTPESGRLIVDAIREPWAQLFSPELPCSRIAN